MSAPWPTPIYLVLVDGNPPQNLNLVAGPEKEFAVIMKEGKIYKNAIK